MNIKLMKNKRKELGMTQQDLADKCGLSRVSISNYESGKAEPTEENLNILSKVLNVSAVELALEDDYEITLKENEVEEMLDILENNFVKKIEYVLKKKYKYITKTNINIEKTSLYLTNILKNITNKNILYSTGVEKVILIDKNKNITSCDFVLFEQCVLNIISIIENINKNTETEIKNDFLIKILNFEKEIIQILKQSTYNTVEQNKKGGSDE